MKYQQPTFTLPVSSKKVTQEEWDRIFTPEPKKDSDKCADCGKCTCICVD